jgi:hypothetical protein
MNLEIIITLVGLTVAGTAAILGIWMERDRNKPPRYAYALSVLILMATFVSMFQTYQDAKQSEKIEADMARMLQMLDKIATTSEVEIPELNEFVKTEVATQSRANPAVVQKMAQRMADEGEDPTEALGSYLPAADVEKMQRKGELKLKPPTTKLATTAAPAAAGTGDAAAAGESVTDRKARRRRMMLGGLGGKATAADAAAKEAEKKIAEAKANPAASAAAPAASASAAAASASGAASAGEAPRKLGGLSLPAKPATAPATTAAPAKPKIGGMGR